MKWLSNSEHDQLHRHLSFLLLNSPGSSLHAHYCLCLGKEEQFNTDHIPKPHQDLEQKHLSKSLSENNLVVKIRA